MRLLIVILPWLELFTLIQLGIMTSALTALVYVLVTSILGLSILQRQGRGIFERVLRGQGGRIMGPQLLMADMAIGFAGFLLMIPGMITDLIAVVVLIAPLRRRLVRVLTRSPTAAYNPTQEAGSHTIIEGTYQHVDDEVKS